MIDPVKLLVDLREAGFSVTDVDACDDGVKLGGVVDLRADKPKRRREDRGVDALLSQAGGKAYEELIALSDPSQSRPSGGAGDMAVVRDGEDE